MTTAKIPNMTDYEAEPVAIVTDSEGAAKFDQVREQCPSIRAVILAEHTPMGVEREGWQNYQTTLRDASPEFTGEKTRSDDPCLIYFTSGTVGYPKMVLHTRVRLSLWRAYQKPSLARFGGSNCANANKGKSRGNKKIDSQY